MIYFLLSFILCVNALFADPQISELTKHQLVFQEMQDLLKEDIKNFQIPGMAVAIYHDGNEYFLSYGFADQKKEILVNEETLFKLASVTKVFTSTLLSVELVESDMKLSDPVSKYLHLSSASPKDIDRVTLLQLATHTSSLPRVFPKFNHWSNYTTQKILNFLNHWEATHPIGTRYFYSNAGFGVLGIALENATKTHYMALLERLILKPLNMNSTYLEVPQNKINQMAVGYNSMNQPVPLTPVNRLTPGSGALISCSRDMLKFLKCNIGVDGPKNLMNAMDYAQKEFFFVNNELSLGLGWQRFTSEKELLIIDKNGGIPGFSSYIGFTKKGKKTGIVILVNKRHVNVTEIGRKIIQTLQN